MFVRASTLFFAIAASVVAVLGDSSSQCNTGTLQCCDGNVIGASCIPIISGMDCRQTPLCCNDNNFNGVVNVGCTPIDLF